MQNIEYENLTLKDVMLDSYYTCQILKSVEGISLVEKDKNKLILAFETREDLEDMVLALGVIELAIMPSLDRLEGNEPFVRAMDILDHFKLRKDN